MIPNIPNVPNYVFYTSAINGAFKNGRLEFTYIPQKEAARRLGITPRYLSMLDEYAPPRLPQERGKETLYHWPVLAKWWEELERVKAWCKEDPSVGDVLVDHGWRVNRIDALEYALERLPEKLAPQLVKVKTQTAMKRIIKTELARVRLWARDDPKDEKDAGPSEEDASAKSER